MSKELPTSWATAPLDSLCQKFRGVSYGREDASSVPKKGFVPILRANNLQNDRLTFDELVWVSADHVSDQQKLRTGDIVIAMSSGSKSVVGKTAQVMEDWQGSFGAFCGVLRPWPELNSRYVGLFLRTREYRSTISELAAGSNINNLKNEHLAAIEVPVAPLTEQRRIVAKLETLLGKVDASQQRLAKIPILLKRFRQSVLAAACSGRLTADWREEGAAGDVESVETLPEGWRNAPLSEFLESSFYGPRFGKESYASEGVPTIRTTDMGFDGSIVLTDAPRIKLSRAELEKYRLWHGDLVVTRTGATIGKCAVYDESRGPAIPGAYLIRFRFKQDLIAPKYVLRFFMSLAGQNLLIGGSNAVAQPNVNATTISQFLIPVPPLPEQQEIVRRVEGLFALADQLEERLAKARGHVEKLTPSLLARAFSGQLVPQDPTDEPAEKLLERIRTQAHTP